MYFNAGCILAATCICPKARRDEWQRERHGVMERKRAKGQRKGEEEEQMERGKARRAAGPVKLLTSWCEPGGSRWHGRWVHGDPKGHTYTPGNSAETSRPITSHHPRSEWATLTGRDYADGGSVCAIVVFCAHAHWSYCKHILRRNTYK